MAELRICEYCGGPIQSSRQGLRFCSHRCSTKALWANPVIRRQIEQTRAAKTEAVRAHYADYFWSRVNKTDGCWIWTAAITGSGYGNALRDGRNVPAHRVAWELVNGPIPDGLYVCHKCDASYPPDDSSYRRCVRPDHLFLGTPTENMRDCAGKKRNGHDTHPERTPRGGTHPFRNDPSRHARGERVASATLTEEKVIRIRRVFGSSKPSRKQILEIAAELQVGEMAVYHAAVGDSWTHVHVGEVND